jgi:hypothetical protein
VPTVRISLFGDMQEVCISVSGTWVLPSEERDRESQGAEECERTRSCQPSAVLIGVPCCLVEYIRAFIHKMDPTGVPFLPMAVCPADHLLGLQQKASSTTCQRAFLPLNKHKRHFFWTFNYAFGRANVRVQDMIDVDEAGFKIENTNPSFGKTVLWLHCYLEGEYNWEKKVNCMMAISADPHYDMEWHNI